MADLNAIGKQREHDEAGVVLPILQRNGKPYLAADGTRATITVLGSESKRYRQKRTEAYRKATEAADEDGGRVAIAVAAITDWHGWELDGKPLPLTPENARLVLGFEHILLQVEGGIGRGADFFDAGSPG